MLPQLKKQRHQSVFWARFSSFFPIILFLVYGGSNRCQFKFMLYKKQSQTNPTPPLPAIPINQQRKKPWKGQQYVMNAVIEKSGAKSSGTAPGNVFRDGARAMSSGTAPRHHHHQQGYHNNAFRDSTRAKSLWKTPG